MRGIVGQRRWLVAGALVAATLALPAPGEPAATDHPGASAFVPVGPQRMADTREPACGCVEIADDTVRVQIADRLDVADPITAVAITLTATPSTGPGFVTAYPSGSARPLTSTLNTRPDRVTSNSTVVPIGADGAIDLYRYTPGDLVVDVTGVFVAADSARAGRLVAITTHRLVDTRDRGRPLSAGGELDVALPPSVASDATAVVVNVTSVAETAPGFLSARATGTPARLSSFSNPDGSGRALASSTIVPVSPDGFTISSHGGGHVVVDITGWFTGPSAADTAAGLFVSAGPTRLLDTRVSGRRLHAGGEIELPFDFDSAAAAVTNITVTQTDRAGYVVAYPAGTRTPNTSSINASTWNDTIANGAISRVSDRGIAYWSLAGTDLVVDLTGWFVGEPVTAERPPLPNVPVRSRVLLVGDSTLAGTTLYTDSLSALRGIDATVDAASCRRLLRPSCLSNVTGLIPNTAVEAIMGTPGPLDVVVVKAGYNDWFSDFPAEFDAVVRAARAKGAHTTLWLTQNERVNRTTAQQAYRENNVDLRRLTALPAYSDVVLADWLAYSDPRQDWFHDGTHVGRAGAYAITDYTARWIAALEHRPCPRPWVVGGAVIDPCVPPELIGPVPDPVGVNVG